MAATKKRKGLFLVFEGCEGVGKTTQAKLLRDWLTSNGYKSVLTKEPGGDEGICSDIRKILLNEKYGKSMDYVAEFLLFESDRAQHVGKIIKPALEMGHTVISDRYSAGTFAYQCVARKVCDIPEFRTIDNFATRKLEPSHIFWMDLDPAIGLKRNVAIGKRDRFEKEKLSFHQAVRRGYEEYFEYVAPRNRWTKLDASLPIDEIHWKIREILEKRFL
ncbi:MAG: dTMP kinase [Candidatus Harrisonbacteria bacterium]|nr:dTMP kinase [Candidatus Harrisonbacteria bacterium]